MQGNSLVASEFAELAVAVVVDSWNESRLAHRFEQKLDKALEHHFPDKTVR